MAAHSASLTDKALHYLHNKIQNCEYMPGEPLLERAICEEIGCGRTPVREALLALQKEGSVEIFPRKGIRVVPFTYPLVNEIYQSRKIIEPTVCSKYYLRLEKHRLLQFDRQFYHIHECDDKEYFGLDVSFHTWLISAVQNRQIQDFFHRIMCMQYRFSMYTSLIGTAVRGECYAEHHNIIEAILTEDPQHIASSLVDHINYSQVIALRTLQQAGALDARSDSFEDSNPCMDR